MTYWKAQGKAQALRAEANEFMDANNIAPTPAAYELCFHYRLGADSELRDALDAELQQSGGLKDSAVDQLFAQFFTGEKTVGETTNLLEKELQALAGVLEASGQGTSAFGRTLSVTATALSNIDVAPQVRGLIEGVAAATRLMSETNKALELRLESSTKEIAGMRTKMESLRRESLADALTGLANRRAFDETLKAAVAEAEREATPVCVLMCDIDHFKKFNDTWGHATGDQVLRLVAQCVSTNVKGRDTAARYGGEELVVILPNTSIVHAATVAEQIRRTVETRRIVKKSTGESYGSITLSIGVSELNPGETVEQFLERADVCLYEAKRSGRNRVCKDVPPGVHAQASAAKKAGGTSNAAADGGSLMELQFPDQQTEICIDPEVSLQDAGLQKLYEWWKSAAVSGMPSWNDALLDEIGFIRSITHLYKVGDDTDRFLVKQIGSELARQVGGDPSGFWLPDSIGKAPRLSAALCRVFEGLRLSVQMKSPLRSYSKSVHNFSSGSYKGESLYLPFSGSGRSVDYLLVATVARLQASETSRVA